MICHKEVSVAIAWSSDIFITDNPRAAMARTPLHPAAPKVIITTIHYSDVIMGAMASQITGVSIVYWTICSDTDQRKLQSSASLAFLSGIHRWPVNSPHKGPVTWKCFHLMTSSCPGAASVGLCWWLKMEFFSWSPVVPKQGALLNIFNTRLFALHDWRHSF